MTRPPPKLETRSGKEISHWVSQQTGFAELRNDPLSDALVHIFARYCELIIERLNQAPEKNYRAFLNEIGVSQIPPAAAQVPLTFTPARNSGIQTIWIPPFTKVAAPPGQGENSPVVFETNQPLTLTRAVLKKTVALDTIQHRYADVSPVSALEKEASGRFPFDGRLPVPHECYIGIDQSIIENVSSLRLDIGIEQALQGSGERQLEWRIANDADGILITVETDGTLSLSRSGSIIFGDLPKWEPCVKFGEKGYWLICRLCDPILQAGDSVRKISAKNLPWIGSIDITGCAEQRNITVDRAFCNGAPIDISKDFFPFGERPHFGDTFYLGCRVFSQADAHVSLKINLTNPASGKTESPVPRVDQSGRAVVQWEYWNGLGWGRLECRDDTQSLTEDGAVSFKLPPSAQPTRVNGVEGGWIRGRLISGHYGLPERVEYNAHDGGQGIHYHASTLAPPVIESMTVNKTIGPVKPARIIAHNDFICNPIDLAQLCAFAPFQFNADPSKAFYFGFKADAGEMLAGRCLDLYFCIEQPAEKLVYRGDGPFPVLSWQCWNGTRWEECKVKDDTHALHISGLVSVRMPAAIGCWKETSLGGADLLYWLRSVWISGDYVGRPVLRRVLLNTTLATQTLTLENEILGSGTGAPNQRFYSARIPIVDKPILEVREPQLPAEAEWARILEEEGQEAIDAMVNQQRGNEIWVRWHEVDDFQNSGHSDRHYVIERLSGEIRFGNGLRGMLLPQGANNIRLSRYRTGGGTQGNKPVQSIAQLRTSLPFVASVINSEAAKGGADIEDWSSVYARGSRLLRHRGRAVTAADYEDLAKLASPLVARAKCFPLKDLGSKSISLEKPGVVSMLVVPKTSEPNPRPTFDLLRRIWKFIDSSRDQGADLIVLGPDYVGICVQAKIMLTGEDSKPDVAEVCRLRLEKFLHPLTGGGQEAGWAFGELPHPSDLYALLESVPGLEYVRSLRISYDEERPGLLDSGIFLVCSGKHSVTVD